MLDHDAAAVPIAVCGAHEVVAHRVFIVERTKYESTRAVRNELPFLCEQKVLLTYWRLECENWRLVGFSVILVNCTKELVSRSKGKRSACEIGTRVTGVAKMVILVASNKLQTRTGTGPTIVHVVVNAGFTKGVTAHC
jgi:hypothetical protein